MSNALEQFAERQAAERDACNAQEKQKADMERTVAHSNDLAAMERLERLAESPDLKWFMEAHLAEMVAEERAKALDVLRSAAERSDHAQRCDFGCAMLARMNVQREEIARRLREWT